MVDTINPNTNAPDDWDKTQPPVEPAAQDNRFYGGFDKPDETKINLADSGPQTPPTPVPSEPVAGAPVTPPPSVNSQPVADVAPVKPAEVKHTSYVNTADMINWRGILVIVAIGLVVTALVGMGLYFGLGAMNNANLDKQQAELDSIQQEIASLDIAPDPLELPVTETPAEEVPVVVPVETPTETPVVVPSTTNTSGNGNG